MKSEIRKLIFLRRFVNIESSFKLELFSSVHAQHVLSYHGFKLPQEYIILITACPKFYCKSVLHLPKYTVNLYLMQYRFAVNFGTLSI